MNPIALIDGDIIAYSVASATEGKRYKYKGEVFDSKSILNKILKDDGVDDSAIESYSEPEPIDKVKESTVSYTENIINLLDGIDYKLFISGKSNFRYDIATILPYKGNRDGIKRPYHLDSVRQLLVDSYGADVTVGMEADDAIGLAHREGDVITTVDKDLNCIPGDHFNWVKEDRFNVTPIEADAFFYCQVVTGDSTDNILGLYGMGSKAKVLDNIRLCKTEEEMFNLVRKEYECRFGSYWKQFMLENCNLLWIMQQRIPLWKERLEV